MFRVTPLEPRTLRQPRVSRRVLKVPKAIASPTSVSWVCPRTPSPAAGRFQCRHMCPFCRNFAALATGRTPYGGPTAPNVPSSGPVGTPRRSAGITTTVLSVAAPTGSRAGLRPAPNGSRRPTNGDVHAVVTEAHPVRDEPVPGFPGLGPPSPGETSDGLTIAR